MVCSFESSCPLLSNFQDHTLENRVTLRAKAWQLREKDRVLETAGSHLLTYLLTPWP
jgi:hypothetical protein